MTVTGVHKDPKALTLTITVELADGSCLRRGGDLPIKIDPFPSRKVAALVTAILLVAGACSSSPAAPAVAGPSATPVTTVTPTLAATPTVAATPTPISFAILDGEPWIVYQSPYDPDGDGVVDNGLYMVRPDGRDQHLVLTTNAGHPDWSPDGKRIVFDTEDDSGIWTVNADGTNVKTLIACVGAPCAGVAHPAWSPDGKHLAFDRSLQPAAKGYEDDQISIEVLDLATGMTRTVAISPLADTDYVEYSGPRWSPDGKQIAFMVNTFATPPADDNVRSSAVAVVTADGSEVDAPRILTDASLWAAAPDWSPDGQRIAFNTYPINYFEATTKASNIYTIRPDGTDLTQITHFGENDVRATRPNWTPNGKRIIFTHITPDGGWGDRKIAFIDPDGSNVTLVPTDNFAWLGRLRPTP